MLTCVYSAITQEMKVVEEDEAFLLMENGEWFDNPLIAKENGKKISEVASEINEAKRRGRPPASDKKKEN